MKKLKYKIIERSSGGHGGLYELEEEEYFDVVEIKTGKVLMTFEGQHSASFEGGVWANWSHGGVERVEITPDEQAVLVFRYGMPHPEIIQLPK